MDLASLVAWAAARGASDLHLESGRPPALRVRGQLVADGEPLGAATLSRLVDALLDPPSRATFAARRSADLAATLAGVRCRINVLQTSNGPGLALRLLPRSVPTLASLNLHPSLGQLVAHEHGLLLVTGPTGSGKSSTLAALVEQVNRTRACHVVSIEQPIEFELQPRLAYLRQREVGRDTPSFEQALLDALREDPDVLVVGELRERATMRLTLDACETGHLVLATLHAATPAEALARVVSAFPAVEQDGVRAQLAQVLRAVVAQRLVPRDDLGFRVPECEVLTATPAVAASVRQGQLFRLATAMETGAGHGMWSRERYRAWLAQRTDFAVPWEGEHSSAPAAPAGRPPRPTPTTPPAPSAPPAPGSRRSPAGPDARDAAPPPARDPFRAAPPPDDVIVVQPPGAESLADILSELEDDDEPRRRGP